MTQDIDKMSSEELAALVEQYPWFAAGRVELCRRTAGRDPAQYSEVAAYAGDLSLLYRWSRHDHVQDMSDNEVKTVIKGATQGRVRVAGGDFFSQDEYNEVKEDGDDFMAAAARAISGDPERHGQPSPVTFCTEALAEIYAEQGYFDQARYIYSQLILRYPEKSAYFAVLIDELNKKEKDTSSL